MDPRFRPFFIGLLGCLAALGHAPAWLHVWRCDDASCCVVGHLGEADEQPTSVTVVCGGGCHHHHDERETAGEADQEGDRSGPDHDHDTCSICQSLSAPCGVTWKLDVWLGVQAMELPLASHPQRTPVAAFRLVAAPRGPPANA